MCTLPGLVLQTTKLCFSSHQLMDHVIMCTHPTRKRHFCQSTRLPWTAKDGPSGCTMFSGLGASRKDSTRLPSTSQHKF
jgi:hypothetical protein